MRPRPLLTSRLTEGGLRSMLAGYSPLYSATAGTKHLCWSAAQYDLAVSLDNRSDRIRHDVPVHVYVQVAADIQADIDAGRLAPGARLPSEIELSQQYGVARLTARRAVTLLREQGKVVTLTGRGTYVATPQTPGSPQ